MTNAKGGDAEAQYTLGMCYWTGRDGVDCDAAKAVEWWSLAAAQGHTDAQFQLGACFLRGEGPQGPGIKT